MIKIDVAKRRVKARRVTRFTHAPRFELLVDLLLQLLAAQRVLFETGLGLAQLALGIELLERCLFRAQRALCGAQKCRMKSTIGQALRNDVFVITFLIKRRVKSSLDTRDPFLFKKTIVTLIGYVWSSNCPI